MRSAPAWEDPRKVLARHGLAPKRSFSQSFLVSHPTVERIADAVEVAEEELVIELGPGVGTLTGALLRRGARVLAVERDRDMAAVLRADLGELDRFRLLEADAATVDLAELSRTEGVALPLVGNLPYAITGAILRNLTAQAGSISRAVLMVQREVRDRLLADPGTRAWGALTVFVTAAFAVEPVMLVSPGSFHPRPRVQSAVVRLRARAEPRARETPMLSAVVRAVFDARRKTLRNALLTGLATPGVVDAALSELGLDPGRRGETLGVEDLATLAKALQQRGAEPRGK